jgi:hypothetical protein
VDVHRDLVADVDVRRHAQLDTDRGELGDGVAGEVLNDERDLLADDHRRFAVVDGRDPRIGDDVRLVLRL